MSEIKEFDENSRCPKCGYDHIDTSYRPAAKMDEVKLIRARNELGFPLEEHLVRKCPRCGFAWPEGVRG